MQPLWEKVKYQLAYATIVEKVSWHMKRHKEVWQQQSSALMHSSSPSRHWHNIASDFIQSKVICLIELFVFLHFLKNMNSFLWPTYCCVFAYNMGLIDCCCWVHKHRVTPDPGISPSICTQTCHKNKSIGHIRHLWHITTQP